MSVIDELKAIVSNQKTIRTSRLAPILKDIETMYIQQAKKIERQKKSLNKMRGYPLEPYNPVTKQFNIGVWYLEHGDFGPYVAELASLGGGVHVVNKETKNKREVYLMLDAWESGFREGKNLTDEL